MWHDSCDMTHVTWLVRDTTQPFFTAQMRGLLWVTCRIYKWHDSCDMIHVTWLVFDMNRPFFTAEMRSLLWATCRIHKWRDHVTWLILDMTQPFFTHGLLCVTFRIHKWHDSCDMTNVILLNDMTHTWYDSAVLHCENARFIMCDMPYS